MIVRSISTRGKLGILNLEPARSHSEFQRFNLIYGWNRCGKTTLSRVFEACERKSTGFKQFPEGGRFRLKSDSGQQVTSDSVASCDLPIRVFNQDFIDRNVSFDTSECEPIVYVSEADIEAQAELVELRGRTDALVAAKTAAVEASSAAETAVRRFLEATALSIKNTVGNLQVQDTYRNYDKRKLQALLDESEPAAFRELDDEVRDAARELISSEPKPRATRLGGFRVQWPGAEEAVDLARIHELLAEVTTRAVASKTLGRLSNDPALNAWVRTGFQLQIDRELSGSCPYCEAQLQAGFLDGLAQHFSDDYEALVRDIQASADALMVLGANAVFSDVDLYSELTKEFKERTDVHAQQIAELAEWVESCRERLEARLKNPIKPVASPPEPPEAFVDRYNNIVADLNRLIDAHNTRVENHAAEAAKQKDLLASHIISEAMRVEGYPKMIDAVSETRSSEAAAISALDSNRKRIEVLALATSNIGAALERINAHLSGFFGGSEIALELDPETRGYVIRRDGRAAENLSEGEKTAIAFAYFIAKTQEREFRVSDGVIVIDDPVSSLDSNYIYHCFALIQRHFQTAGQLFVLTHNFELFNLTKSWFKGKNRKVRGASADEMPCAFYTIETALADGERVSSLAAMDATLRDYNSEYQYLFARLCFFAEDGAPTYTDLYTIGNIARRFLEIFAGFKIPTTADLRGKVEQLPTKRVSDVQKDKLYRLVQAYSHADDPTCAVAHKDRGEAQEAVRVLLDVVEDSDGEHYRILKKGLPGAAAPGTRAQP